MADEKKSLSGEELEKVSGGWIIKKDDNDPYVIIDDDGGQVIGDYPSTNQK